MKILLIYQQSRYVRLFCLPLLSVLAAPTLQRACDLLQKAKVYAKKDDLRSFALTSVRLLAAMGLARRAARAAPVEENFSAG